VSGSRRGRSERGAALVEFALLAPLIFALLMGMFTGGMSLSRKNSMTNAIREGARFGSTLTEDVSWAANVQARVAALAGGDLAASQVCVVLVKKGTSSDSVRQSAGSGCGTEPSTAGIPVGECAVKVWSQRQSDLEVIFFSRTLTLQAGAVSRYERDCT